MCFVCLVDWLCVHVPASYVVRVTQAPRSSFSTKTPGAHQKEPSPQWQTGSWYSSNWERRKSCWLFLSTARRTQMVPSLSRGVQMEGKPPLSRLSLHSACMRMHASLLLDVQVCAHPTSPQTSCLHFPGKVRNRKELTLPFKIETIHIDFL